MFGIGNTGRIPGAEYRRPNTGLFESHLSSPVGRAERREIIDIHLGSKPLQEDVNKDKLAELTGGYTGADIETLANMAVFSAIKGHVEKYENDQEARKNATSMKVSMQDFEKSMRITNQENSLQEN